MAQKRTIVPLLYGNVTLDYMKGRTNERSISYNARR